MARTFPQELRDRVLAAYYRGIKTKQIADVFMACRATHQSGNVREQRNPTGRRLYQLPTSEARTRHHLTKRTTPTRRAVLW